MKIFALWLISAGILTALAGLVYVAVQQDLRQGANDPQIQLAEDVAAALSSGAHTANVLPQDRQIDIALSLAPFVEIFDDTGKPVASNGLLDGVEPRLPAGVLEFVRRHGQESVTWQPQPNVRIAAVVVRYLGTAPGFVLAGRSLREVEIRENRLTLQVGAAWVLAMLLSVVGAVIAAFWKPYAPQP